MKITVVSHPLAQEALVAARHRDTGHAGFRRAMSTLASMLIYEATASLPTHPVTVDTPLGVSPGVGLTHQPLLVPIIRAGLSMLEPAVALLPDAAVAFMGMRRSGPPIDYEVYLSGMPADAGGAPALLLDPMLATGGSTIKTASLLAEANCGSITAICALTAPEGIEALRDAVATGPLAGYAGSVSVFTAAIDSHLNEHAFIVPGLGDAGDRLYGEPPGGLG